LADVFDSLMGSTKGWAGLVVFFGLDVLVSAKSVYSPVGAALLVAAGIVLWKRPDEWWAAGWCTAAAFIALVGPASSTETAMVMWVSAAVTLFSGTNRQIALRAVVVTAYLFAGLNKLVFHPFRSGAVIELVAPYIPAPRLVAAVTIAIELGLGVAVLVRWRWSVPAILAFHIPVALFTAEGPWHAISLMGYGVIMAWAANAADRRSETLPRIGEPVVNRE
jgi:hypothetical protein